VGRHLIVALKANGLKKSLVVLGAEVVEKILEVQNN
jgi:hypothetical protein